MTDEDWTRIDAIAHAVLLAHDGVAKLKSFLDGGVSGRQAAALVGRGVLDRPRYGWYCDPALPWEGKHAIRVGGVLDCVSAVDSLGLPVPTDAVRRVHVRVQSNSPRRRHHRSKHLYVAPGQDREVVLHWDDRPGTPRGWRVSLVEALLHLADCVPMDWWIAALDAARHRTTDTPPMLSDVDWEELGRRIPRRLRRALDLVDPRAESVIESLLRLALIRRGVPIADLQFWPSTRRRVDLLLPGKLILEADGEQWHDPIADAIRDAELRALGYRVLHFTYDQIVNHIDEVVAMVLEALHDSVS